MPGQQAPQSMSPRERAAQLRELGVGVPVGLVALMVLTGLTEGIGLVLVVPLLAALGGGPEENGNALLAMLRRIGVPMTLTPLLATFVVVVVARAWLVHRRTMAGFRFEVAVVDRLRGRAWHALNHCDWRAFSALKPSAVLSVLVNSIDLIGEAIGHAVALASLFLTIASVGAAALAISPQIALGALLAGGLVLLAYGRLRRRAMELGQQVGAAYADIHAQLGDGLRAARLVRTLGMEQHISRRGVHAFDGLRRTQLAYLRDVGLSRLALQGGGALFLAGGLALAIGRWHADPLEVLPLVALSVRALPLLGEVQQAWQGWRHGATAIDDALELIHRLEQHREPDAAAVLPHLAAKMEFSGVTVNYDSAERPALPRLSLTLRAGEMLGVTGPSGCGKSTLADLAAGLLGPDDGTIAVDRTLLCGPVRTAWRSRVAYLQQESVFVSGSIRENLLWADPAADDARIAGVLAQASAHFVLALPEGLDTRLGEGGRILSGGERQRLALARALLRKPDLLILDEPTAALDPDNEASVAEAIAALKGRLTILLLAHRGPLLKLCDRVIELPAA